MMEGNVHACGGGGCCSIIEQEVLVLNRLGGVEMAYMKYSVKR
jgi:hypothetical protein